MTSIDMVISKGKRTAAFLSALLLAVVVWCGAAVPALSQGFDWQYSARLPSSYPTLFLGVNASGAFHTFSGDINYLQGVVLCGTFRNGDGSGFGAGVQADHWLSESWAVSGTLRFEMMNGLFESAGDTLARAPNAEPTIVGYEIESDFSYVSLDLGARYRPLNTSKLFVGAGVQAGYLLSHSTVQRQRIVSPASQRFNDGSQEQSLSDNIVGFSSFYAGGRIIAGIDLPLGRSLYTSPAVYAAFPLTSMAVDTPWQRVSIGVQVSVLYGLVVDDAL